MADLIAPPAQRVGPLARLLASLVAVLERRHRRVTVRYCANHHRPKETR